MIKRFSACPEDGLIFSEYGNGRVLRYVKL